MDHGQRERATGHKGLTYQGQRQKLQDITAHVVNHTISHKVPPAIAPKHFTPSSPEGRRHRPDYSADDTQHRAKNQTVHPTVLENKRLSAVTDSKRNSKRDSCSSASTNTSAEGRRRKSRVGPWLLGPTLGHGATGRVRKARHAVTGVDAAIKIVSRNVAQDMRSESVAVMDDLLAKDPRWASEVRVPFSIEREVLIMKLIQHPNVIQLYDVWENRGEMYLVLEYVANGELFTYILDRGQLPEPESIRIFRQIMSGIEHCHYFKLCHRDLKPENILLDANNNVKIVDFGMSSIQHSGWMHTSCGSPHYAAPEVVRGGKYNGEKADIWSAGVVLYVMLVGRAPFAPDLDTNNPQTRDMHLREILQQVCAAEVLLPHWISDEAEDLVLRLLEPDPIKRITIPEIWAHPLLQKYESQARRKGWLGGSHLDVAKTDCGSALEDSEIDMDIVSSLCMLWHTTSETGIIRQLRNPEPNFERLLYHRLLRSRREQEENFHGAGVEVSSSDYHHVGRHRQLRRSTTRASSMAFNRKTTHSQYSIAGGSKRRPSERSGKSSTGAETDKSYDPFRASRDQIVGNGPDTAKVTLLRGSSLATGSTRSCYVPQHPAIARLQDDASSKVSSTPPVSWPRDANGRYRTLCHSGTPMACHSKSSFGSSTKSAKSSRFRRSSASYKRGVSFSQMKRRSSSPYWMPPRPSAPSPSQMKRNRDHETWSLCGSEASSLVQADSTSLSPPVISKKEGVSNVFGQTDQRGSKRLSVLLKEEARQVSIELGKYCDDAFQESVTELDTGVPEPQLQPSQQETILMRPPAFAVPPPRKSSINQSGRLSIPRHGNLYRDRPLPEPPKTHLPETAAVQKLRRFKEARATILRSADFLPPGTLNDAIVNVDKLIQNAQKEVDSEQDFRIISAPVNSSSLAFETTGDTPLSKHRYVSEPSRPVQIPQTSASDRRWLQNNSTIRLVGDDMSVNQHHGPNNTFEEQIGSRMNRRDHEDPVTPYSRGYFAAQSGAAGLVPIKEEKESKDYSNSEHQTNQTTFRNWFRRSASSTKSGESGHQAIAREQNSPHQGHRVGHIDRHYIQPFGKSIDADIEPRREMSQPVRKRTGWFGFFGKRVVTKDGENHMMVLDDSGEEDSVAKSSAASHGENNERGVRQFHANESAPAASNQRIGANLFKYANAPAQNWIARFLKVKPAKRVLALQMKKTAALKEIREVLRDWKRHGMRDVITDKASGKLWARVDIENALNIKPVSICIEFYTVLFHGKKHGLSLARFTQEGGARSSFQKVVKTMEGVLRGRELLVQDKTKVKKMRRCLKEWDRA